VLEGNCVHCHGKTRLAWMPPLDSTASLSGLIGPHRQIVPGKPEASRFFQVVTLADDQAGAMPPTGHALDEGSVQVLRAWISAGAQVPQRSEPLQPSGEIPRSR
jgi:mono/diheme cytochrome c family protein